MTAYQFDSIAALHHWSLNYEPGRNPFCVFMDLIGYSEEVFGMRLFEGDPSEVLGYKELCLLANALRVYEDNGHSAVHAAVADLLQTED